jgi:hypothetical protein
MDTNPFGPLTGEVREAWSQAQRADDEPDDQEIVVVTPATPKQGESSKRQKYRGKPRKWEPTWIFCRQS